MTKVEPLRNRAFLKQFLDQGIYRIGASQPGSQDSPSESVDGFTLEGARDSQVAILIRESDNGHRKLLENILSSVRLQSSQVLLIMVKNNQPIPANLLEDKARIVSFGCTDGKNPFLSIQTKYASTIVGETSVILADSLQELNNNQQLKKELWACLKSFS